MVHISNTGADSVYSPGDTVCVDFTSTIFKGPGSEELPFKIPQVCTYESGSLALPPPPTGDDSDDGGSALAITAGVIGGIDRPKCGVDRIFQNQQRNGQQQHHHHQHDSIAVEQSI